MLDLMNPGGGLPFGAAFLIPLSAAFAVLLVMKMAARTRFGQHPVGNAIVIMLGVALAFIAFFLALLSVA